MKNEERHRAVAQRLMKSARKAATVAMITLAIAFAGEPLPANASAAAIAASAAATAAAASEKKAEDAGERPPRLVTRLIESVREAARSIFKDDARPPAPHKQDVEPIHNQVEVRASGAVKKQ